MKAQPEKFYITTPIYYVNDVPHIGHTYTTVAADVLARWNRLLGKKVFFLTGTDEHGAKIFDKAKEKNKNPKEYCDEIVEEFKRAWKEMNISFDYFIRTTDPNHEECVKKFLTEVNNKAEIYKAKYEGLYCIQCEKFLTETELTPEGLCPDHKVKLVKHSEENYFFQLSKYREEIIQIISDETHQKHFEILPQERKNEIVSKLKLNQPPLTDISISRAGVQWAIPLPFDPTQTTYVWIDALINYISAIGYHLPYTLHLTPYTFSDWWPADIHLIGKDILWFHTVIWPAMLLSVGLPLPKKVFAHGYFTVNGEKMSKTLGNVISPKELTQCYGSDATRLLLLCAFPFGSDGDISMKDFREKYNAYLADNIGNLISRVINMVNKYLNRRIPKPADISEIRVVKKYIEGYIKNMEHIALDAAIKNILDISTFANQYVDKSAPWNLAKTDKEKLEKVLYNVLTVIKCIAVICYPFMPIVSDKLWKILDEKDSQQDVAMKLPEISYLTGSEVKLSPILFPKKIE